MANATVQITNVSSADITLEDGAWKDSFDKLLEPRSVLRELNVIKKDVRVSFNIDSSVENSNCENATESLNDLPKTRNLNLRDNNHLYPISTPNRANFDALECTISPINGQSFVTNKTPKYLNRRHLRIFLSTSNDIIQHENQYVGAKKSSNIQKNREKKKVNFGNLSKRSKTPAGRKTVPAKTSLNFSDKSFDVIYENLVLQPGKWRKSLKVYRRTCQSVDKRFSEDLTSNKKSSIQSKKRSTVIGSRKSIRLTSGPVRTNKSKTAGELQVLQRCGQREPLEFDKVYSSEIMEKAYKIGEGLYGEVFLNPSKDKSSSTVLKIIPIEGSIEVNNEVQKTFQEVLPEIVISTELSNLCHLNGKLYSTPGFVNVKKVSCVRGKYPQHFIKLWEEYDDEKGSENDHPKIFDDSQKFIVLELNYSGKDLEKFVFNNAEQSYYIVVQIVLTLAVAEEVFQFEHRDLHWGNVLIDKTDQKSFTFMINGREINIPTMGLKATIIDYTLSRVNINDLCLYNDLSCDDELFEATGDYQFEIYRLMRQALKNKWDAFEPKTNVFWISYIIDKMLNGVCYKNKQTRKHASYVDKLTDIQKTVLESSSASSFACNLLDC